MTQTLSASYVGSLGVVTVGSSGCDFTAAELEPLIDQAIDMVNLEAGLTLSHLSGTAGSKSLSLADDEIVAVGALVLILAVGSCLSRSLAPWPVDRQENMKLQIAAGGYLHERYRALVRGLSSKQGTTGRRYKMAVSKYAFINEDERYGDA